MIRPCASQLRSRSRGMPRVLSDAIVSNSRAPCYGAENRLAGVDA